MVDLFGNEDLFMDFDKRPDEADVNKDNVGGGTSCTPNSEKPSFSLKKDNSVITLESGRVLKDYGKFKLSTDEPFIAGLSALGDRPNYSSIFRDPLTVIRDSDENIDKNQKSSRSTFSCFNCGGPHMLNACKQPKDYGRIAQKRREFNEANPQANRAQPQSEYGGDYRQLPPLVSFDHFKAGHISNVLRQALGLYPNQLPPYIYFFRVEGYPPGWLEEARVSLGNDEVSDIPLYNPELIVEYPGFNSDFPRHCVDESRHFGVSKMDPQHSAKALRHWMEALQKHHEHRRSMMAMTRKQEVHPKQENSRKPPEAAEVHGGEMAMDLDDTSGDEAQNTTYHISTKPLSENEDSAGGHSDDGVMAAADLESLENEREKLLRLLESTLSGNVESTEASTENEGEETGECDGDNGNQEDLSTSVAVPDAEAKLAPLPSTSLSLGVSTGTPLPESLGTPVQVPNRERFASGIGVHLPFEMISNSVGTFERLKKVLAGIRKRDSATGTVSSPVLNKNATNSASPVRSPPSSSNRRNRNRGYVDYDDPNGESSNRSSSKGASGRSRQQPQQQQRQSDRYVRQREYHQHPEARSANRYRPY